MNKYEEALNRIAFNFGLDCLDENITEEEQDNLAKDITLMNELVVTCKVGKDEYKKNYIYLNEYTMYVVEDITGTHTDPYHYKMYFHTELPVTVETKP